MVTHCAQAAGSGRVRPQNTFLGMQQPTQTVLQYGAIIKQSLDDSNPSSGVDDNMASQPILTRHQAVFMAGKS
ncbi:hypothetical protein SynBIOSE41_03752 [Synechococcus sp. BIOS-E4-1]|uniref:hypothetical protein n=1 Tax=Synechococcus sp. BIOS-E4-1 TaxID=1400864 RepID=UPI001644C37E|nr:hypothetical protein [Synechococcus sp. BIOS-E4-1]QNI56221.1 hypothetical protein SynBIOSE41_03752 [Synechococcus sp. BIOS-E4-1]